MARRIRWIPVKNTLIEVTYRIVQERFLLRPSPELNDIVLGILGRAQRLYPIGVCAVTVLSNHLHLLLIADDAEQVTDFMQYLGSNLAREVNRTTGWSGPVFQRRYSMIVVTDEEAAQVKRLEYVLAQGCKENLVERPRDWPGIGAVRCLLDGEPLTGHWFDRTREYAAQRRRGVFDPRQFAAEETLILSPIPCWHDVSAEVYRQRVAEIVSRIERESTAERAQSGARALGARAVLAQHPHHRPETAAKSPAPLVHAATRAARLAFREAYGRFVEAFRHAAERLRGGDRTALFPPGSFPPALPFVPG
jgi:REP element-mobilizing transposase RayT